MMMILSLYKYFIFLIYLFSINIIFFLFALYFCGNYANFPNVGLIKAFYSILYLQVKKN